MCVCVCVCVCRYDDMCVSLVMVCLYVCVCVCAREVMVCGDGVFVCVL